MSNHQAVSENQTPWYKSPWHIHVFNFNASFAKCSGNCQTIDTVWAGTYCLTRRADPESQTPWYTGPRHRHAISMLQISNVRDIVTLADLHSQKAKLPNVNVSDTDMHFLLWTQCYTRLVIQTRLRVSLEASKITFLVHCVT